MSDLPFTTFEDNEALASADIFKKLVQYSCPQMEGRPFTLMLDTCPCPHCETPLIVVVWRPLKDGDPIDDVLDYALWESTELPEDMPRVLTVWIDGIEKQVCINHSKGLS